MVQFPNKLNKKLEQRKVQNTLRKLGEPNRLVDFASNDYLGFARSSKIFEESHKLLLDSEAIANGATGSRLLSGNHQLYTEVEALLCQFHQSQAALVCNSGYDANIGFFSSVPQKGDIIFYDEYIHASIRDGISMSHAKSYKFKHNNLDDVKSKLERLVESASDAEVYIVAESVYSMDGDSPDLKAFVSFCDENDFHFIVDEAHALGVFGEHGEGLVQQLGLEDKIFARLVTFGKALGCHGSAILGSEKLKQYLVNFSRSFIYTTALPPHALATIKTAYSLLKSALDEGNHPILKLHENIGFFKQKYIELGLADVFIESDSAIQGCIISGNTRVKEIASNLQKKGFDVKPILSPTVPQGQERLRFCLHSYNSQEEIAEVLKVLATFVA
ncbi:aminotransferase class I/II-fold pyridoxal phosphate-dependent enzyme [Mangrovimonas aestuarii]|uniref:aminotransferase class I/II-fold pyridoxal phosphate-dependent enzyme n=1 Tax=Mangrovimonas aestuarii TaxID=3018443 RepID=UPI0023790DE6|nr:pyridoxal phosphate-dependent aminotransferase family protein [Mangrovimonas aestuarii]